MLRPLDTILLALGRYRPWARERMVYRALIVLTQPQRPAGALPPDDSIRHAVGSTKYAMRMASTRSPPRS